MFDESLEQRNIRVLSRFSVFDLTEQTAEALAAADEMLAKNGVNLVVTGRGISDNCIEWFFVESGAQIYEVRRFENFCFCSCRAFWFGSRACKHIAATFPHFCAKCRRRETRAGEICRQCEMDDSAYFSGGYRPERKPEKLGNIRF